MITGPDRAGCEERSGNGSDGTVCPGMLTARLVHRLQRPGRAPAMRNRSQLVVWLLVMLLAISCQRALPANSPLTP